MFKKHQYLGDFAFKKLIKLNFRTPSTKPKRKSQVCLNKTFATAVVKSSEVTLKKTYNEKRPSF